MNDLFLKGNRLAYVILAGPIVIISEPGINNAILKLYEVRLIAEVFLFGMLQ